MCVLFRIKCAGHIEIGYPLYIIAVNDTAAGRDYGTCGREYHENKFNDIRYYIIIVNH